MARHEKKRRQPEGGVGFLFGRKTMPTHNHVKNLSAARERALADRRDLAKGLGEGYRRGHTENMRDDFLTVHALIKAIDEAIERERTMIWAGQAGALPVANATSR
jgi:hypothetical protein